MQEKLIFTFQANKNYRLGFYCTDGSTVFPRKDSPTVPYTIVGPNGNITITQHWAQMGDVYPPLTNIWIPFFRIDL